MSDQQPPWAERTVELPPEDNPYRRGVASVGRPKNSRTEPFPTVPHEPTGTGWPGAEQPAARRPLRHHLEELRRGGEWSAAGGLFAFVCWGIWAISARGDLTSPVAAFVLTLLIAAGLFALTRLLGRVVWERQLGRPRRTARGAHLLTGLFLAGVGIAYLRQTDWVMSAWHWIFGP
ncbi:hypothetical protein [Plantactinospora sp. GCM10030261]|uniref:hypothetical protein n=1 Tax=Plantactinospora sp. GCM10030261 TaxID=3273420 RepID=UPI003619E9EC